MKGATPPSKSQDIDPPLNEEHRRFLMEKLSFDQANSRRATIKKTHLKTCKWLFQQPKYQDWLDQNKIFDNHSFFWIKKKFGMGKSMLMKYTLEQIKKTLPKKSIVISFFFNARGEKFEKSIIGMYRSLLFQLLQRFPKLQCVLDFFISATTFEQWDVEILKNTFFYVVEKLEQKHLLCLVDALDECLEDQI